MPMYDLKCKNCGKEISLFCSFKDKEKAECPECGSKNLQQVYGSIGIGRGSSGGGSAPSSGGFT